MNALRVTMKVAGIALAAATPALAQAQLDDATVVSILRECRKIADVTARTACYDNIPLGQTAGAASPAPTSPAPAPAPGPRGFGASQVPRPAAVREAEPDRISAQVDAATRLAPGLHLLTLEDGAQWEFVDAVSSTYDPPVRGSTVEISAGALGGYLMTYDDQRAVRVRRVR